MDQAAVILTKNPSSASPLTLVQFHPRSLHSRMDPKNRSTKPSTQDKAQTSKGIPSSTMYNNFNPIVGQTVLQGSPYHTDSQNMYISHSFPNTTHFHIGPTMGFFTPIPIQEGQTPTNASYYIPQLCVGSPNSLPFTFNQHVVIYQQFGQNISNHTSNADPITTPQTTMHQNSTDSHSSQTMNINHPMSQNTTHFHIGPTMGSFVPIPNQGGKTPTNASYDHIPQTSVGSPNSLPFTYNQHVVIYQQSGQTISNHTSNADHMNPNQKLAKENEARPNEGNTLKKRKRTSDPGYEAVDLRNSPNFGGSQEIGQGLADLVQEVNNLKMLVGNLSNQFNTVEANLKGKFDYTESLLRNEFCSMRERNRSLKRKIRRLQERISLLFDQDVPQVESSTDSPSSSWGD